MFPKIEVVLLIIGAIFFLLGMIAKIDTNTIRIGTSNPFARTLCIICGILFIFLSLYKSEVISIPKKEKLVNFTYTHKIIVVGFPTIGLRKRPLTNSELSNTEISKSTLITDLKSGTKVKFISTKGKWNEIVAKNEKGQKLKGYISSTIKCYNKRNSTIWPLDEDTFNEWIGKWEHISPDKNRGLVTGEMNIRINDSRMVNGDFTSSISGTGILKGLLVLGDKRIEGTWSNQKNQTGKFVYNLGADKATFFGVYSNDDKEPMDNLSMFWNGIKVSNH